VLIVLTSFSTLFAQDIPQTDSLGVAPVDTLAQFSTLTFPEIDGVEADSIGVLHDVDTVLRKKEPAFKTRVTYKASDSVNFDDSKSRLSLQTITGQLRRYRIEGL